MQVGASSAAWIAAVFTFIAFGLGFLVLILPISHDVALWLMWLCFGLAGISAYGAYVAHYRKRHTLPSVKGAAIPPKEEPTVVSAGEVLASIGSASFREIRGIVTGENVYMTDAERVPAWPIGRRSRAASRGRLEYEERQRARHLEPKDAAAIIRKVSEGLSKLAEDWLNATPPVVIEKIPIVIVAIGTDRETLNYRRDLADALAGGGLRVVYQEWLAGSPEYEQFVGSVTVLEDKPTNRVRPFIIDALRAAGINPREAPWPVRLRVPGHYDDEARLWLLVGQCR